MVKTPMAKRLVVDIETKGVDFHSLDEMSQEYILKFADTDEKVREAKEGLAFSPLTGEVVAIGMLNPETEKGAVYFQAPDVPCDPVKEDGIEFISDTEAGILRRFWDAVRHYDQIITFNGRAFDAPFLMIRSAIHRIKPSKDLMPSRYSSLTHIDLLDQLTFYGSVRRKFSLHMWCRAFGIRSPKEGGVTGHEVSELFSQKKYLDIARYCTGDLYATKELFEYWIRYVKFSSE
jgi:DNA polymerase elongation subunit (family B)